MKEQPSASEQTNAHNWRLLRSESGPHIKLFQVRYDWMLNPRNGAEERMVILEGRDSANVIAITPEEQVLFVRQYRFGIQADTLELPGGLMEAGEALQTAAARELVEETGYTGSDWQYLGKVPSNPVFMDSYIHHWVLRDARLTDATELDAGEAVELVFMSLPEVKKALLEGVFQHPHTVTALLRFFSADLVF
ncbi:MAG: NUDIX hydrolase [Saprospiraceae bacterium]|nr:NUDIX hydrolase [Saprospiraceae bacterium]